MTQRQSLVSSSPEEIIMQTTAAPDDDLLPLSEVTKLAGIGKTMIYRLERKGDFPERYKPGGYASRWSRREVMEWRERQRGCR